MSERIDRPGQEPETGGRQDTEPAETPAPSGAARAAAERARGRGSKSLADQVADYDVQLRIADSLDRIADSLETIVRTLAESSQRAARQEPRYRGSYPPRPPRHEPYRGEDQGRGGREDQPRGFGRDRQGGPPRGGPGDRYRRPRRRWERS